MVLSESFNLKEFAKTSRSRFLADAIPELVLKYRSKSNDRFRFATPMALSRVQHRISCYERVFHLCDPATLSRRFREARIDLICGCLAPNQIGVAHPISYEQKWRAIQIRMRWNPSFAAPPHCAWYSRPAGSVLRHLSNSKLPSPSETKKREGSCGGVALRLPSPDPSTSLVIHLQQHWSLQPL